MTARYRNPWFKRSGDYGPEYYETDARPLEHAGCLIYQRIKGAVWDVVKDGVCCAQRAGLRGAKEAAEGIAVTEPLYAPDGVENEG